MPKGQYQRTQSTKEQLSLLKDPETLRILEIRYERVFPVPGERFASERLAFVAAVEEGQVPNLIIQKMKKLAIVNSQQGRLDLARARAIVQSVKDLKEHCPYSVKDVNWAEALVATMDE